MHRILNLSWLRTGIRSSDRRQYSERSGSNFAHNCRGTRLARSGKPLFSYLSQWEGTCECTEERVAECQQGVVLQLGSWAGANNSSP
jgi:hypothetical protein